MEEHPVVCHWIERLGVGGAETVLCRLAIAQRDGAYRPMVFCLNGGPLQSVLEREGIPVVNLELPRPSVARPWSFLRFSIRLVRAAVRTMRARRVEIIHAHLPDSILLGALVGALTGTKVLGMYHGLRILPSGRSRFDPRNRLRALSYRLAGTICSKTVAVSTPVGDLLCGEIGLSRKKVAVIPNGVAVADFARADVPPGLRSELGLGPSDRVVVSLGRLVANKGQRFVIEAMVDVTQACPEAVLLLVGDGPEKAELKRLANDLEISTRVKFAGERSDVPQILALAEIFAHPSLFEGIPLSVLEAMAAGKPIVLTRVPGNVDVIGDESCGRLVPPGEAGALSRELLALLGDRDEAARLGARAQARVRSEFDSEHWVSRIEAVYEEVLGSRNGRARAS